MKNILKFLVCALIVLLSACTFFEEEIKPKLDDDTIKTFTITLIDENGDVIDKITIEKGQIPKNFDYDVSDNNTAEYEYEFLGWSRLKGGPIVEVGAVNGDITLYANVTKNKRSYTITFLDENGDPLDEYDLVYGTTPEEQYSVSKMDEQYVYTFVGWSETENGKVVPLDQVSSDKTYYAVLKKELRKYTITFADEKGRTIEDVEFDYGSIPSYNYDGSSSDLEYNYTLNGWSTSIGGAPLASLPKVTGDAVYYASVEKTKKQYTVTFDTGTGASIVSPITGYYNDVIQQPTPPTKQGYEFTYWNYGDTQARVTFPFNLTKNVT